MLNIVRYIIIVLLCISIPFPFSAICGELDCKMSDFGLVDVQALDSTIMVDLMYAGKDNFVGEAMYKGTDKAYLHPDAALALKKASAELHRIKPGYRLKICDAARPMSVQRRMYNVVRGTSKAPYVSNPSRGGGLHNYGLAVDVTIVDDNGQDLDMGTKVDHLGVEANIDKETVLVIKGIISEAARQNRLLLRRVMSHGGFHSLRSEWWHFNLCTRAEARRRYKVLDF